MSTGSSRFRAGKYLLETLTSGMYNEPMSIYREYIQNSVDAIDQISGRTGGKHEIRIDLNPFEKQIKISDNGIGVPSDMAEETLSSIGSSNKIGTQQRGFRGIGRLGGIAFARNVTFRTKAPGEKVESIQKWDCSKLRELLAKPGDKLMTLEDLFQQVTSFYIKKSRMGINKSFFEVTLDEVESFKNHIFDITRIRDYLCQVAPLPFNPEQFSYSPIIMSYLKKNLTHFDEYQVLLNGEKVYQSYKDRVRTTSKKTADCIEGIETFEIKPNGKTIAYGWLGKRRELLGSIHRGDKFAGIRVKVGNIMIGDQHLLDRCFREARFNGYLVGEIHISDPELTPNSRRDDFVDNKLKNLFYNEVEKVVGLPMSKEIRLRSRQKSEAAVKGKKEQSADVKASSFHKMNKKNNEKPFVEKDDHENDIDSGVWGEMLKSCKSCQTFQKILNNSLKMRPE